MSITEVPASRQISDGRTFDDGYRARPRTRRSLAEAPTEHLEAEVTALAERLHFGTYELLVLVGELDERGSWATWGALSCAAWLADVCDIEVCTARTQVRVAKAMREYPVLDEAMARGAISYAKARTLVAHLTDDNADALVMIARTTPAGRLGAAIAAWCLGHEDQDVIDARQHDARSLSWHTTPDGTVVFTITVPPEDAGRIAAIIDIEVIRHDPITSPRADRDVPDPGSGDVIGDRTTPHASPTRDYPSLTQQRADALLRLLDTADSSECTCEAERDGGADRVRISKASGDGGAARGTRGRAESPKRRSVAEVVVHVRPEGNTLADGTPLSDHAVSRLLPEAFVSLLIEDDQRYPIDASPRRRFPTRRQRRVVDARETECAEVGCHTHDRLQYDHREPFDPDRPNTVVDNLQRLCGPHNRAKGNR